MSRFRSPTVIIAAGLLVLLPMTAASCDDEDSGIRLGTATVGDVDEIVEAPGTVVARTAATLTAPAAGTLTDLLAEPGEKVAKGDVLAVIRSPELERRRDAAEQALDQAPPAGGGVPAFTEVRHRTDEQAGRTFDQAREAAGRIADPELRKAMLHQLDAAEEQYAAAAATADAALRSVERGVATLGRAVGAISAAQQLQAQQAYDLADAAVDALTLRAPVAGVVQLGGTAPPSTGSLGQLLEGGVPGPQPAGAGVDTAVPEGGYVAAGAAVVTVVDTSRLGLAAEVDETDVLLVEPGVEAAVELDAAPGAVYTATVRATDLLPTTSARGGVSYQVRLDLGAGAYGMKDDEEGAAAPSPRPGMSAVIRLTVRQATGAVIVPASAVVTVDGQETVWVVRDGRYEAAPVTLGVQGEDTVQVVSGVDAGRQIVVSGADRVTAGAAVE